MMQRCQSTDYSVHTHQQRKSSVPAGCVSRGIGVGTFGDEIADMDRVVLDVNDRKQILPGSHTCSKR